MTDWQHSAEGVSEAARPQSPDGHAPEEIGIGAWLAFWLQLAVLSVLAILGAFFASADLAPGDDVCGLILSVAAVLLAFLCIKGRFDGRPAVWDDILVDDMANLVLAIVVFVILGLGGIFVAAAVGEGGLYVGGVALFAVSAVAILMSMKRVFDILDHGGH